MAAEGIPVSLDEKIVAEFARDLNEYVVSLDRIMSRLGTGDYSQQILVDYIVDRNVLHRLALMREVICDALEAKIGSEALDEVLESTYFYQDPSTS